MSFSKIDNIQNLNPDQLEDKIIQLKKDLFDLQIKKATKQSIKTHLFKHKKHELAQILTIKHQKLTK